MRLTFYSNAPWAPTGYGTQTAQLTRRLAAAGHDVAIAANYGIVGQGGRWEGMTVYPQGIDTYSNDVLSAHHIHHTKGQPAWLLTLFDVWVIEAANLAQHHVASWTPIDHSPVPPKVAAWAREHYTIAMSQFGRATLAASGIEAQYAPHALEPDFRPAPSDSRAKMGVDPDAFVVMVNGANKGNHPPRKAWAQMLQAFSVFASRRKDAVLYLHTDRWGQGGVDLGLLAMACDIDPDRIRFAEPYAYKTGSIDSARLAELYTMSDVLLATSMGEGFGIPVIEAQACGTPVIVTNFSAQPELVGAGWTVGFEPYWDDAQAAWLAYPRVMDIVRRLDEAYEAKGDAGLRGQAIAKAAEYGADKVFAEYWTPILADMERRLTPTRNERRAARKKRSVSVCR